MKDYLQSRRSTKIKHMTAPGPNADELKEILQIAARVPDHGKLSPFYFIVFQGTERATFGKHLRHLWAQDYADATQEQLTHEENRFMRAPLVVAVVSRIRESKIPVWEQLMCAGACCYNLCLAANACGYGTNWLSEWYSFDERVHDILGLEKGRDNIAGFIYIGTATEVQDDRERPDLNDITNLWTSGQMPDKKGNNYNKDGAGIPHNGFTIIQSEETK